MDCTVLGNYRIAPLSEEELQTVTEAATCGDARAAAAYATDAWYFHRDDKEHLEQALIVSAGASPEADWRGARSRALILAQLGRITEANTLAEEIYAKTGQASTDLFLYHLLRKENPSQTDEMMFLKRAAGRGLLAARKEMLARPFRKIPLLGYLVAKLVAVIMLPLLFFILLKNPDDPRSTTH